MRGSSATRSGKLERWRWCRHWRWCCCCHCCHFCCSMTRGDTTNSQGGQDVSAPDTKRGTTRGGGITRSGQLEYWHQHRRLHRCWHQCWHWHWHWHHCCHYCRFHCCCSFRCHPCHCCRRHHHHRQWQGWRETKRAMAMATRAAVTKEGEGSKAMATATSLAGEKW
jgi:hypothetical protein